MRRILVVCLAASAASGCDKVDRVLEGHVAPNAHLSIAVAPSPVEVQQGGELGLTATITRVGDYQGPVALTIEGLPTGVTAVVGASPTGQVTTASMSLRVAADVKVGSYLLTIRVSANELTDATTPLRLDVVATPTFDLALSASSLTVSSGGSAPFDARLTRSNFTQPVKLTLEGNNGFSLTASENPLTSDAATLSVSVASSVAPGSYSLTVRAVGSGLTDRTVPLTVVVTSDPYQLATRPVLTMLQGQTLVENLVVNRAGYSAPISPSVAGLPSGVSSAITPSPISGSAAALTLTVDPDVAAGSYTGSLRASGTSGQVVSSAFSFVVQPSNVAVTVLPSSLSIVQGSSTTVALSLTRISLVGAIGLSATGLPAGVIATFDSSNVHGNTATITIAAGSSAVPGQYTLNVRATPSQWPVGTGRTVSIALTVKSTVITPSDAILDWTGCAAPAWVAYKDGTGAWTQVTGSGNQFRFTITSALAGYAYAEGSRGTTAVRFVTQDAIASKTLDMCPVAPGTKSATGTAFKSTAAEQVAYSLGGGTASSSSTTDQFTITGIRPGTHDLMAWGFVAVGQSLRGLLRRDVNLPDGGSLGIVSLIQTEGFTPAQGQVTLIGAQQQGESVGYSVSYYTTAACTQNPLYTGGGLLTFAIRGVPDQLQRPSDFHLVTATLSSASSRRSASLAFHSMGSRQFALAAFVGAPDVSTLPGVYKRLQAVFADVPSDYNGSLTLNYADGAISMTIGASSAWLASSGNTITMPDFSAVAGWSANWAVSSSNSGTWLATLDGESVAGSVCTEGRRTVQTTFSGLY